jgi:SPP1 family holin
MKKQLKKIDNKWVRAVVIIIVGGNAIATMFGYPILPFEDEQIIAGVSSAALIGGEIWNHWKNNNWTPEAERAQKYLDGEKEVNK